jgi:hypothetical protein
MQANPGVPNGSSRAIAVVFFTILLFALPGAACSLPGSVMRDKLSTPFPQVSSGVQPVADTPVPAAQSTQPPVPAPTDTATPAPTATLPTTPAPTETMDADPSVYDNFNNPAYDGSYNPHRWTTEKLSGKASARQENGVLVLSATGNHSGVRLEGDTVPAFSATDPMFLEAKLNVPPKPGLGYITFYVRVSNQEELRGQLALFKQGFPVKFFHAWNAQQKSNQDFGNSLFAYDRWYTLRIEVVPEKNLVKCFVDGVNVVNLIPKPAESLNGWKQVYIEVESLSDGTFTASVEDLKFGGLPPR